MNKLAVPAMLAAVVLTQTGCPVCNAPMLPMQPPANHDNARIAEGAWVLEMDRIERDGRCGGIEVEDLRRLHAFVEHRGQRGLFIDIEGLVTRGEQHGSEVVTYGIIDEDIAVEEPPHHGDEDDTDTDTDYDTGEEDGASSCGSSGGGIAPPPCEEVREGEREETPERPEASPYYGVAVTLSGLADGPHWMDGDLFIDLYEAGDVTCTLSARFSGAVDERARERDPEPGRD